MLCACAPHAAAATTPQFLLAGDGSAIHARRILTPADFDRFGPTPVSDFDIDAHGRVIFADNDVVYVLEPGESGVAALPLARVDGVRSIGIDGGRALLVLTRNSLDTYYDRSIVPLLRLPEGASIAHVAAAVYAQKAFLYGSDDADSAFSRRVLEVDADGTVRSTVEADRGIVAASDVHGTLYFATHHTIYRWRQGILRVVIRLPSTYSLRSIAADQAANHAEMVYFSTDDGVYALKGLTAIEITRDLGGTLRSYQGVLFVLDLRRRALVRIDGVENL